jgi:hypothetical protein
MKNNNYKNGLKLIKDSPYVIRKLVTFEGHEGFGVNADVHVKRKKVATIIDEGNGGEPYFYYYVDGEHAKTNEELDAFASSLPPYSLAEKYSEDTHEFSTERKPWTSGDVINALVDVACERKDFKKTLRKIIGFKDGTFFTWKHAKKDLERLFRHKGKQITLREIIESDGITILNLLPEDEAFDLLRQHS